jgi:hypothetical protein
VEAERVAGQGQAEDRQAEERQAEERQVRYEAVERLLDPPPLRKIQTPSDAGTVLEEMGRQKLTGDALGGSRG